MALFLIFYLGVGLLLTYENDLIDNISCYLIEISTRIKNI